MPFLRLLCVPWLNHQAFHRIFHFSAHSSSYLLFWFPTWELWLSGTSKKPRQLCGFKRNISLTFCCVLFRNKAPNLESNSDAPQVRNNINHDSFHLPGWTLWMAYRSRFKFKEHLLLFLTPCNKASIQLQLTPWKPTIIKITSTYLLHFPFVLELHETFSKCILYSSPFFFIESLFYRKGELVHIEVKYFAHSL